MSTHTSTAMALERLIPGREWTCDAPKMTFLSTPTAQAGAQAAEALVLWPTAAPLFADICTTFDKLGFKVADRVRLPLPSHSPPQATLHRYWFRVAHPTIDDPSARISEAFEAAHAHGFDIDDYAVLITAERLSWRDVVLVRAVSRFLQQAGLRFSHHYIIATLLRHPGFAQTLVAYFAARFDPAVTDREGRTQHTKSALNEHIERAITVDDDRILRALESFATACLRTNWYQNDAAGNCKQHASFMLDSQKLAPAASAKIVPYREIFVHSNDVEGVHVRSGLVARGGLRLSDRTEDFRTEVLGLLKTQIVKNSPIVPVGAKGAFVRRNPSVSAEDAYTTFVRGLLDVMDNYVNGEIVPPPRAVTYGGPDAYLVVAADKGTARFSDLANSLALGAGFWLGDAFASGGSAGYDHKAIGITARGAWVCVTRHFKALGVDVSRDTISVVGIGDMSGDVFGNGMLLSRSLKLIAAFDHRHIFIDPDPDPAQAFEERLRLFSLPGASWDDYDRSVLSEGGGVWPRTVKRVRISPQVRTAIGVDATELAPAELIKAILRAPVDLLWNGGIGTYVKASHEPHAAAADPANDAVRINADGLRCRVVGEGGNLGVTQRGRIEYALGGGRINADFIDNAAGVATSDHEVNLKIALGAAMRNGTINAQERDDLLTDAETDVVDAVLESNKNQDVAISLAESHAPALLNRHERLITHLESNGINRDSESLPAKRELASRSQTGKGLTRPEIAVLLAHSKNVVKNDLLLSSVPDDPDFAYAVQSYFPSVIRDRLTAEISRHHLAREIVATRVADDLINHVGPGLIYRLEERLAVKTPAVARAYAVVREVFNVDELWARARGHGNSSLRAVQRFIEHTSSWILRNRTATLNVAAEIARYKAAVSELIQEYPVPSEPGALAAWLDFAGEAFALQESALTHACAVTTVGDVFQRVGEKLSLDWTKERLRNAVTANWWDSMASASVIDELNARHHELTSLILESTAEDAVSRWQRLTTEPIARFTRLTTELQQDGIVDVSRASTLNVELALLIRSTRACISEEVSL